MCSWGYPLGNADPVHYLGRQGEEKILWILSGLPVCLGLGLSLLKSFSLGTWLFILNFCLNKCHFPILLPLLLGPAILFIFPPWYQITFYLAMGLLFAVDTGLYFSVQRDLQCSKGEWKNSKVRWSQGPQDKWSLIPWCNSCGSSISSVCNSSPSPDLTATWAKDPPRKERACDLQS